MITLAIEYVWVRVMKNQYQNWWTIHWLSEFQARWAGAGRAWEEGQVDYEIGKLERADFDGLSGELVGKLFDSNAHPFYRPVLVFAKLNRSDCQTIRQWFQQNESALMDLFNGHLSKDIPDSLKDILFAHSVKSFYCSCGCTAEYCSHLCALIYKFLEMFDREPIILFNYLGLNFSELLPENIRQSLTRPSEPLLSLSELLTALVDRIPVDNKTKPLNGEAVLGLLENAPSYFQVLGSIFRNEGNLLEKSNLNLIAQNCLVNVKRIVRPKKEGNLSQTCEAIENNAFTFIFDDFESRLAALNIDKSIKVSELDRKFLIEQGLMAKPFDSSVRLLFEAAKLITLKCACLPLIFKTEHPDSTLPRLLWMPAVNEPCVNVFLNELFKLPDLLDIEKRIDKNSLKSVAVFRTLANKASTQMQQKEEARRALIIYLIAQFITGLIEHSTDRSAIKGLLSAMLCGSDIRDLEGLLNSKVTAEIERIFQILMAPYVLTLKPVLTVTEAPKNDVILTSQPRYRVDFGLMKESALLNLTQKNRSEQSAFFIKEISKELHLARYREVAKAFLNTISSLHQICRSISTKQSAYVSDDLKTLQSFLLDTAPSLMMLGVRVVLDKKYRKFIKPNFRIRALQANEGRVISFFKNMDFKPELSIDGKPLTEKQAQELLALMPSDTKEPVVVNFLDYLVELDPQEVGKFNELKNQVQKLNPFEQLKSVISNNWNGYGLSLSQEIERNLSEILDVPDIELPKSIQATLRPYQIVGYKWLMKNITHRMGALIADDMGLGKTLQVISAITKCCEDHLLEGKPILIVVPAGVLHNWGDEFKKFSPSLKVKMRLGDKFWQKEKVDDEAPDVILTTYSTLTRHFQFFSEQEWGLVVADEAQYLKNPSSARSMAFRLLKAREMIAMTGTPIENRLMDIWSIFASIQPKLLGNQKNFINDFAIPIEKKKDPQVTENFRKILTPFVLRREKTDPKVINDLPQCFIQNVMVKLTPFQAYLYKTALKDCLDKIPTAKKRSKGFLIIRLLAELKKICNSPSQFLKKNAVEPDSGKANALMELLPSLLNQKKKILIFTQYRQMGLRLQNWIEKKIGERPEFLNGSVTLAERNKMIRRFQNDSDHRILLISLKAGGVGLNLTAASVVIHYDLWWNPAVEQQATDRAYRIGQNKDVTVYRLICEGSFEERIDQVLVAKRKLAENVTVRADKWLGDLSTKELQEFFKLI